MVRRTACFIIEAPKGQRVAAQGAIRAAFRTALGDIRQNSDPHYMHYMSAKECKDYGMTDGRFIIELTDAEFDRVLGVLPKDAWVDAYHD